MTQMNLSGLALLGLLIVCVDKGETGDTDTGETGDTDTGDTDTDTGDTDTGDTDTGDTDTDTGETGDTDTGETGDTDTGDTSEGCEGGPLQYTVEVRDSSGLPCTACALGEPLTLHGAIYNPSPVDVVLTFRDGCFISVWAIEDEEEVVWLESFICTDALVDRTIPACGALEDAWTDPPVTLEAGSYTLSAQFDDEAFTVGWAAFVVE